MKKCSSCKLILSEDNFSKNKALKDWLDNLCKKCKVIAVTNSRIKNKDKVKEYSKEYNKKYKLNPEKQKILKANSIRNQFKRYSITEEEYNTILKEQNYVCAICGKPENTKWKLRLAIDHNHKCCSWRNCCWKCIRWLLCWKCNKMLWMINDDVDLLQKSIQYLQNYS